MVVLLLVVALQGTVWLVARNALNREVRRVMDAELDKLGQDYVRGGVYELVHVLRGRADSWGRTGAVYLLTNNVMGAMAGNLSAWPRDVQPRCIRYPPG